MRERRPENKVSGTPKSWDELFPKSETAFLTSRMVESCVACQRHVLPCLRKTPFLGFPVASPRAPSHPLDKGLPSLPTTSHLHNLCGDSRERNELEGLQWGLQWASIRMHRSSCLFIPETADWKLSLSPPHSQRKPSSSLLMFTPDVTWPTYAPVFTCTCPHVYRSYYRFFEDKHQAYLSR